MPVRWPCCRTRAPRADRRLRDMKLILTNEVSGLGAPGDVVEVKDGYGRNYLIPRGFAIRWTRGAETQISSIKKARDAREIRDVGSAKEVAGRLGGLKVVLKTRA